MKDNETADAVVHGIIAIVVIVFLFWSAPKVWGWWVRNWQTFNSHLSMDGDYYCKEIKKIVKADPIFEDNGKHEDESYRVTYEDGSVGLVDQAAVASGTYCVSSTWVRSGEKAPEGWVLAP